MAAVCADPTPKASCLFRFSKIFRPRRVRRGGSDSAKAQTRGTGLHYRRRKNTLPSPGVKSPAQSFRAGSAGGRGISVENKTKKSLRAPAGAVYSALKWIVKIGTWAHGHLSPASGFPPPMNADKISLSASDAEVQDALKVVDALLVSHGFVRDEKPDNANVKGFIASYSKPTSEGLRRLDELPSIYFKANHVEIVFFEGRTSDAHNAQLIDALQKELAAKYGADRVRKGVS